MSHSFFLEKTGFSHDGDYKGHVTVIEVGPAGERVNAANVPFDDLETFVYQKYKDAIIEMVEELNAANPEDQEKLAQMYWGYKND